MQESQRVQKYWMKKLDDWDESRYRAHPRLNPIASRSKLAFEILAPHIGGKKLLELGCGRGRLAEPLLDRGAQIYKGVDLNPPASSNNPKIQFVRSELLKTPRFAEMDIVFSLGLVDWLNDTEIRWLGDISKDRYFLHSFSLQGSSLSQYAHRLFSLVNYTFVHQVSPRYFEKDKIIQLLNLPSANFFNHESMLFSTFVTNLPLEANATDTIVL